MEGMIMKKQPCMSTSTSPSSIAMHKENSKTISKEKPKIRIIHIFAPEIIKTDVANFRELVQKLTGKPTENSCKKKPRRSRARRDKDTHEQSKSSTRTTSTSSSCDHHKTMAKRVELRTGFSSFGCRERVKEEEEMWNGANSGSFLGGFADLDGFSLGEFPLMSMDANQMNGFGETQISQ